MMKSVAVCILFLASVQSQVITDDTLVDVTYGKSLQGVTLSFLNDDGDTQLRKSWLVKHFEKFKEAIILEKTGAPIGDSLTYVDDAEDTKHLKYVGDAEDTKETLDYRAKAKAKQISKILGFELIDQQEDIIRGNIKVMVEFSDTALVVPGTDQNRWHPQIQLNTLPPAALKKTEEFVRAFSIEGGVFDMLAEDNDAKGSNLNDDGWMTVGQNDETKVVGFGVDETHGHDNVLIQHVEVSGEKSKLVVNALVMTQMGKGTVTVKAAFKNDPGMVVHYAKTHKNVQAWLDGLTGGVNTMEIQKTKESQFREVRGENLLRKQLK